MEIDPILLQILACPFCIGALVVSSAADALECEACGRSYPVRDGIPVLITDEGSVDILQANAELKRRSELIVDPRAESGSPPPAFTATYFPWSIISNPATLNRALVYFDKVYLIGPNPNQLDQLIEMMQEKKINSNQMARRQRELFIRFFRRVAELRAAGAIEMLSSDYIVRDPALSEKIAHVAFLDAISFDTASLTYEVDTFWTSLDPKSRFVHESYGEIEAVSVQYWDEVGATDIFSLVEAKVDAYMHSLPVQARILTQEALNLPSGIVHSILSNIGLAVIDRASSVPLIDNSRDYQYLRNRYRRMHDTRQGAEASANLAAMERLVARTNVRSGILANIALEVLVPDLGALNTEDVLELRDKFGDALAMFRLEMARLASDIRTGAAEPEFYSECLQVVQNKVTPAVLELQKEVAASKRKVVRRLINEVGTLKPAVPFVVSSFAPIPMYAAGLVSAGIIGLDVALESLNARKQRTYDNGVAFILDVRKEELKLDQQYWSRSGALARRYGV